MALLQILRSIIYNVVVVFIKNNMVLHRLCAFLAARTYYGFSYMFYNRRLFVKLIEKIKIGEKLEPFKVGSSKNIRLGVISQNAHRW